MSADAGTDLMQRKRELRARVKQALAAMPESQRERASRAACERLASLEAFVDARCVMLYLPLPGELDCTHLIHTALDSGKTVAVPLADWDSRAMRPVRLRGLDAGHVREDRHGVRVPTVVEPIDPQQIDVVVAPGLAFDRAGRRLGRGGGFYDRFLSLLSSRTAAIGLAFEQQIVAEVPAAAHDAAVSMLVSEQRTMSCG